MINEDKDFKKVSDNDFYAGGQTIATEVASVTTREIQLIDAPNTDKFMQVDIPEAYRVDAKPFIERPFFVGSVVFSTSNTRYSLLSTPIKFLPGDIARSNSSLLNMFKMAAYGRPDLVLNISLAGTITHAGCILAAVLPPLPAYPVANDVRTLINTALTGPYAFLNANEATSVALPVPWYCNTDLATLDMEDVPTSTVDITQINGNYGTLVFIVMNPLAVSTGSSTSLNIVIEACFKHFDMVVPTPRFVTWTSQSGKRSARNPNYEYSQPEDENDDAETTIAKRKWPKIGFSRTTIAGMLTTVSVLSLLSRLIMTVVGEEELPETVCEPKFAPQGFKPQGLGTAISGLFDTVAGGLKKVTGDAIDAGRGWVRDWTGLHNPNDPTIHQRNVVTSTNFMNNVDVPQFFEKLDPDATFNRVTKEPLFGTDLDEMAISHIVQKDQYIGTFTVSSTDAVGKCMWIRPISPFQGGYGPAPGNTGRACANNLELMHSLHRGWRGTLRLKIQSVMNNKQQVKLKVLKFYNPSVNSLTAYPTYSSAANAPSHLLEYTQGGQMHQVELPYLNRNDIQACTNNMDAEALLHGLYYVYVAQPLVTSDGSPSTVQFNVYMSGGPDLTFFGYTTSNTYHGDFNLYSNPSATGSLPATFLPSISVATNSNLVKLADNETYWAEDGPAFYTATRKLAAKIQADVSTDEKLDDFIKQLYIVDGRVLGYHKKAGWKAQSGKIKVMNEAQDQHHSVRRDEAHEELGHLTRLKPNIDIRPLVRRMYKSATTEMTIAANASGVLNVPLAAIVGEIPWFWAYSPIETISRMYYGKNVGFKFRLILYHTGSREKQVPDLNTITARAYYLPQNLNTLSTTRTVVNATTNQLAFNSYIAPSPAGEVPLTCCVVGRERSDVSITYEFTVPNTSFYKFLGSPEKFKNFASAAAPNQLSTLDFGGLVIQIINTHQEFQAALAMEMFVGLTDESRFGFHSIAPPFVVKKGGDSYYLGSSTSVNAPASANLNNFVYRGGYA